MSNASSCRAVAIVLSQQSAANQVLGSLKLTQLPDNSSSGGGGGAGGGVRIQGTLHHLQPGKHGMCVCTAGDLSQPGAAACGPIFNPFGRTHGAPSDQQRMVGDLGNILADENGTAVVDVTDKVVQLLGPHSVIGRSVVITAGEDDMGRGGHENSLTTGNSGPRVAAGVIGISI